MTARRPNREERIEAIRNAAAVREALGQGALYRRLPSGEDEVIYRGKQHVGWTLADVIAAAKRTGKGGR